MANLLTSMTWEHEPVEMAELTESGIIRKGWILGADARITTETNEIGIGPVAYKGVLKGSDGTPSKDGYSRDLVLMFFLADECRRAEMFNQEPGDVTDTMNAFLAAHGGNITTMAALAPTVA